jgi:hypothetical protein
MIIDDDGDPAIIIHFSSDQEIMDSMILPEKPASLVMGPSASACKANFITWMDGIFRKFVNGADVFAVDANDVKIDGTYEGLRAGEWNKIVAFLSTEEIDNWKRAMGEQAPPLSCGRMQVVAGSGRGYNTTSNPRLGPFRT